MTTNVNGADHLVDLVVSYKKVDFAGKCMKGIAVNDQIPAPTLHFQEGDNVTINVFNQLDEETTIHWHGILVPWQMDGVKGVTQEGIKPGSSFQYKFKIEQSGTYWYHAHAGLQEQQGVYGAFIIDPPQQRFHYTKDYVIVLSDWSNTHPEQILANLKKDGNYYASEFPMQPSLIRFICDYKKADKAERKSIIDDYKMMQQMRMSIYDINDVAYDAFLLNGHPKSNPWTALIKMGDIVRLRFIGAAGNSIFHVKLPNAEMEVVHVQGNDVEPHTVKDFSIAPGETVDVLVKIKNDPQIIYVESMDQIDKIYGALVSSTTQCINYEGVPPFPEPRPVTREMMLFGMHHGMGHSMSQGMDQNMNHSAHSMSQGRDQNMNHHSARMGDSRQKYASSSQISKTKYKDLKALEKTNTPDKPIYKTINMELDGWMDRFIWFINGVPEHKAHPLILEPDKRYRLVFKNISMMHHPMHIHGHWFIVRNDHGVNDPLLHTIDMPPGATIIADVDTDASGQWLFHCHLLYHMMSGMSRVFQYATLIEITKGNQLPQDVIEKTQYVNRPIVRVDALKPIDISLVKHPMAHPVIPYFSNYLNIGIDPINHVQRITFKGLYGFDYNKFEFYMNDAEINKGTIENADLDVFFWYLIDQFWALKGGVNYFYRPSDTPYIQPGIGIEGMMPYFIETDIRGYYRKGSVKLDIELDRDTQLTNNFFIRAGIRSILATKTVFEDEIGSGVNQMRFILAPFYRISPGVNIIIEYEHERDYGSLKNIRLMNNESFYENTLTFGLSLLF